MPLYEYKCASCGAEISARQGMRDAPLTLCPKCGQQSLKRKISLSNFSLKGVGCFGKSSSHQPSGACSSCPHNKE
ncbi:MAG: zinc ribbon domain-containing protein [Proteobacteria bacterium]|uniref:Zinc ribbon domain-containing protein n=1 Tax=Candidatus Avisuccinivibrio stercorigallinarum TaxID=2840704 RepID=A0A9D9DCB6_9GAMM|nr:zinc ribbon domain-containing protein [Candidatus Avisuccinivibrio stercorigallinarum]